MQNKSSSVCLLRSQLTGLGLANGGVIVCVCLCVCSCLLCIERQREFSLFLSFNIVKNTLVSGRQKNPLFLSLRHTQTQHLWTSLKCPHFPECPHSQGLTLKKRLTKTEEQECTQTFCEMQTEMMSGSSSLQVDAVLLIFRQCGELPNLRGQRSGSVFWTTAYIHTGYWDTKGILSEMIQYLFLFLHCWFSYFTIKATDHFDCCLLKLSAH